MLVVFPARAGMSRVKAIASMLYFSVPRASGDEPSHTLVAH